MYRLRAGIVFAVVVGLCTWLTTRSRGWAPSAVLGVLAAVEFLLDVFVYSRRALGQHRCAGDLDGAGQPRSVWGSGDLDDGCLAVGGDQLDGDRVADAVMTPLANVTRRASSRSMRCRLLPGRRDVCQLLTDAAGAACDHREAATELVGR
ncbi:MAG TPA: hypothetical protein VI074_14155 [Propionibacteriaceae bacterium]